MNAFTAVTIADATVPGTPVRIVITNAYGTYRVTRLGNRSRLVGSFVIEDFTNESDARGYANRLWTEVVNRRNAVDAIG